MLADVEHAPATVSPYWPAAQLPRIFDCSGDLPGDRLPEQRAATEEKQKQRNLNCLHRFLHGESLVVLMNGGPDDRDYSETGEGGQAVYRNVVSSSLQHDN